MPFRLLPRESVIESVRRIAAEQIDKACDEIDDPRRQQAKTVHQVRKRCKRLRGLVHLVRPAMGRTYRTENAWFRDTAKRLAAARDGETALDTYDKLVEHFSPQVDRSIFDSIRQRLTLQRKHLRSDAVGEQLVGVRDRLAEALERIPSWQLDRDGFAAVRSGLGQTYGRARDSLVQVRKHPTPEAFHVWRKWVKYHNDHCALLRGLWPVVINARRGEVDRLGIWLGEDHDLAVLKDRVGSLSNEVAQRNDVKTLCGLIDQRRQQIESTSISLGSRVFAEERKAFVKRHRRYWKASYGNHVGRCE
ncbi:CHAD domain protein [Novipirellula galeiformis]|uniref:CHAD domain protein n=1 Tax=Novipirellula galeiformis TaxID=2528004 RepID=A0A5C6CM16_9BACT|nr:CHAD domain-containing protein [Novipirellula galeiformis]TWU25115.1 CHAD domain protein [Novipirellula galeiformis]